MTNSAIKRDIIVDDVKCKLGISIAREGSVHQIEDYRLKIKVFERKKHQQL